MNKTSYTLIPALADIGGLFLLLLLAAPLAKQFQELGFTNSLILGFFFVLFCFSVYGIRKLKSLPGVRQPAWLMKLTGDRRIMAVLAVLFALFVAIAAGYVTGFLDSVVRLNRSVMDEPSATMYLLLTPASWFGLALLYLLVLSAPTEATVEPDERRFSIVSFLGLAGVNLMAVVTTAFFQVLTARYAAMSGNLGLGIMIFLLYLVLFAPPRLIYTGVTGKPATLLTFVLLLALLTAATGI